MSTSAFCTFGHYADLGYERLQEVDKLVSSSSPRGRAKAMAGPTSQRACHAAMHSSQRSQHQLHAMHVIGGEASLHGRLRRSQDRLRGVQAHDVPREEKGDELAASIDNTEPGLPHLAAHCRLLCLVCQHGGGAAARGVARELRAVDDV
jgi:hypothetical protein